MPIELPEQQSLTAALHRLLAAPDPSLPFPGAGLLIGLLGFDEGTASLVGSAYAQSTPEPPQPPTSPSELERDRAQMVAECADELVKRQLCVGSRAIASGGLLTALARFCLSAGPSSPPAVGCAVVLPAPRQVGAGDPPSIEQQLFHEAPGRLLLCIPAARQADARLLASAHGVPLWPLGRSGGRELVIRASDGEMSFREVFRLPLDALQSPPPTG